ncbi:XdhC family protein [Paenibacillus sp.]|jgi:xanthine/CO dehydrogenase XdhC/CoxF family maturation factor|uniref:XdhC family protein n=1 Tax=Paenibacillus sp. TaxID=58172 RepID=UPI00282C9AE7|nr:XdhC family protein [Paenibacillus sp.]MDR0267478.1 XdhC family protein [Paenibacillus sp.]
MRRWKHVLQDWEEGHEGIIATLIQTQGSTYQKTGTQMLISGSGESQGQLSGGCLEQDIVRRGLSLLESGQSYGLASYPAEQMDDPIFGFQTGCKGDYLILLEPTSGYRPYQQQLAKAIAFNQRVEIVTILDYRPNPVLTGNRLLAIDGQLVKPASEILQAARELWEWAQHRQDRCSLLEKPEAGIRIYVHQIEPIRRLLLVGGGNDAMPVAEFARRIGYEIHLLDYREAFLSPHRFPNGVTFHCVGKLLEEMERVISGFPSDTQVVLMSHSFEYDRIALRAAMQSGFGYIGVLGPSERMNSLLSGFEIKNKEMIYNPVGLEIGAKTPEEIALSIVSQLVAVTRKAGSIQKKVGEEKWKTSGNAS